MSQITTHVLDTSVGKPAEGIDLTLSHLVDNEWNLLSGGTTNHDGRVSALLADDIVLPAGRYKVLFVTENYFKKQGVDAFYPYAEIVFDITGDGEHYHIPLLLSPFGYSTYRGS
jgi:5-hydroxyisourate hydrolase